LSASHLTITSTMMKIFIWHRQRSWHCHQAYKGKPELGKRGLRRSSKIFFNQCNSW
jgi:hypothetical protein